MRMGQETPLETLPYPTTLEWGSAHDAPHMSWKHRLLKKRPYYPTSLLQLLPRNLLDLPSLGPKVGYLATGQVHPSVPGGSAKPSPSKQQQLLRLQQWQRHHHQLIRVLLWMKRDLRAHMVLNMAMERVVQGVIS